MFRNKAVALVLLFSFTTFSFAPLAQAATYKLSNGEALNITPVELPRAPGKLSILEWGWDVPAGSLGGGNIWVSQQFVERGAYAMYPNEPERLCYDNNLSGINWAKYPTIDLFSVPDTPLINRFTNVPYYGITSGVGYVIPYADLTAADPGLGTCSPFPGRAPMEWTWDSVPAGYLGSGDAWISQEFVQKGFSASNGEYNFDPTLLDVDWSKYPIVDFGYNPFPQYGGITSGVGYKIPQADLMAANPDFGVLRTYDPNKNGFNRSAPLGGIEGIAQVDGRNVYLIDGSGAHLAYADGSGVHEKTTTITVSGGGGGFFGGGFFSSLMTVVGIGLAFVGIPAVAVTLSEATAAFVATAKTTMSVVGIASSVITGNVGIGTVLGAAGFTDIPKDLIQAVGYVNTAVNVAKNGLDAATALNFIGGAIANVTGNPTFGDVIDPDADLVDYSDLSLPEEVADISGEITTGYPISQEEANENVEVTPLAYAEDVIGIPLDSGDSGQTVADATAESTDGASGGIVGALKDAIGNSIDAVTDAVKGLIPASLNRESSSAPDTDSSPDISAQDQALLDQYNATSDWTATQLSPADYLLANNVTPADPDYALKLKIIENSDATDKMYGPNSKYKIGTLPLIPLSDLQAMEIQIGRSAPTTGNANILLTLNEYKQLQNDYSSGSVTGVPDWWTKGQFLVEGVNDPKSMEAINHFVWAKISEGLPDRVIQSLDPASYADNPDFQTAPLNSEALNKLLESELAIQDKLISVSQMYGTFYVSPDSVTHILDSTGGVFPKNMKVWYSSQAEHDAYKQQYSTSGIEVPKWISYTDPTWGILVIEGVSDPETLHKNNPAEWDEKGNYIGPPILPPRIRGIYLDEVSLRLQNDGTPFTPSNGLRVDLGDPSFMNTNLDLNSNTQDAGQFESNLRSSLIKTDFKKVPQSDLDEMLYEFNNNPDRVISTLDQPPYLSAGGRLQNAPLNSETIKRFIDNMMLQDEKYKAFEQANENALAQGEYGTFYITPDKIDNLLNTTGLPKLPSNVKVWFTQDEAEKFLRDYDSGVSKPSWFNPLNVSTIVIEGVTDPATLHRIYPDKYDENGNRILSDGPGIKNTAITGGNIIGGIAGGSVIAGVLSGGPDSDAALAIDGATTTQNTSDAIGSLQRLVPTPTEAAMRFPVQLGEAAYNYVADVASDIKNTLNTDTAPTSGPTPILTTAPIPSTGDIPSSASTSCSPLFNTPCESASVNSCGQRGRAVYDCAGNCLALPPPDSSCPAPTTCRDPAATNFEGSLPCVFPAITVTGHLRASPLLLRSGEMTKISWGVSNASSCTVTGTNDDGTAASPTGRWNTLFSGAAGKTSSPIQGQTTYTLTCASLPGATPASFSESQTVNIIPSYRE